MLIYVTAAPPLFPSLAHIPILVHGSRQLIDLNKLSKWPHLAPRRILPTHTRKHSCNVIAGARYAHTHSTAHTHMRTTSVKRCVSRRQRIQLNAAQAIKAAGSNSSRRPPCGIYWNKQRQDTKKTKHVRKATVHASPTARYPTQISVKTL